MKSSFRHHFWHNFCHPPYLVVLWLLFFNGYTCGLLYVHQFTHAIILMGCSILGYLLGATLTSLVFKR